MRIDSSGNVGIGTTAPNGKLTINGTLTLGNSSGNSAMAQTSPETKSVSTSPVTISNSFIGGSGTFMVVSGNQSTNRFLDLIVCSQNTAAVTVLHSVTTQGSPAARTYAVSGGVLNLTMASGSYSVDTWAVLR
jgi:hypothetical protein